MNKRNLVKTFFRAIYAANVRRSTACVAGIGTEESGFKISVLNNINESIYV